MREQTVKYAPECSRLFGRAVKHGRRFKVDPSPEIQILIDEKLITFLSLSNRILSQYTVTSFVSCPLSGD